MPIAPPQLITGAPRVALPYGLFSVFTFRSGDRFEGGVQFETDTCDPVQGIGAPDCVPGTAAVPGTKEVQQVAITGGPTGGTFVLILDGAPTANIPWNASAAQVQSALNSVARSPLTVAGGPAPGTPFTVTYGTSGDKPALQGSGSGLTGGTAMGVVVTTPTPGTADTPKGPNSSTTFGLPKVLDSNTGEIGEASPFTVYGHFRCNPVGYSASAAQDRATAHLLAREESRVETAFWTGDLGNVPNLAGANGFPEPTVLAGGTAVKPSAAMALLEDWIAGNYGSQGVLHMTRGAAVQYSAMYVHAVGGKLTTTLDTPVVAGAGYPGTGPTGQAADGTSWIYATPAVFGYRSDPFTSSATPGDLFDRGINEMTAIAERTYLLGFDPCGVAAVQVQLL